MRRSGFALVGEEGPEVIKLPAGATVHPSKEVQKHTEQQNNNKSVSVVNYFQEGPRDPHIYSRQLLHELEASV